MKLLEAIEWLLEKPAAAAVKTPFPGFSPQEASILGKYRSTLSKKRLLAAFNVSAIKSFGDIKIEIINNGQINVRASAPPDGKLDVVYDLRDNVAYLVSLYLPYKKQGKKSSVEFMLRQIPFIVNALKIPDIRLVAADTGAYVWLAYVFEPEGPDEESVIKKFTAMHGDIVKEKISTLRQLALLSVPLMDIQAYIRLDPDSARASAFASAIKDDARFFVLDNMFLFGKFFLVKEDVYWHGELSGLTQGTVQSLISRIKKMRGK